MKYLKLFESFSENKFSVTFDMKYYNDVIKALDSNNIKYQKDRENPIYYELKGMDEIIVFAKDNMEIIRSIPYYVKNLSVLPTK